MPYVTVTTEDAFRQLRIGEKLTNLAARGFKRAQRAAEEKEGEATKTTLKKPRSGEATE